MCIAAKVLLKGRIHVQSPLKSGPTPQPPILPSRIYYPSHEHDIHTSCTQHRRATWPWALVYMSRFTNKLPSLSLPYYVQLMSLGSKPYSGWHFGLEKSHTSTYDHFKDELLYIYILFYLIHLITRFTHNKHDCSIQLLALQCIHMHSIAKRHIKNMVIISLEWFIIIYKLCRPRPNVCIISQI